MKYRIGLLKAAFLATLLLGLTICASAQESTEVYGFFETYRDFDYNTGFSSANFLDVKLNGGGGGIAYNFAEWFAMFTQLSFFGAPENDELSVRIINNLQGLRYSTPKYGPFVFYGKGGVGFTNYGITFKSAGYSGGGTKLSVSYAGGVQAWLNDYFGVFAEASHLVMGVPQIVDTDDRDKWESGLTYKTGLALRF